MRVRWLGRVKYRDALALQHALFEHATDDYLLMLEHHHVFTYGASADLQRNLKCDPAAVGAELGRVNRGGATSPITARVSWWCTRFDRYLASPVTRRPLTSPRMSAVSSNS